MDLSGDAFKAIVESLAQNVSAGAPDQRREARLALPGSLRFVPLKDGTLADGETAQVIDFSAHGIGLKVAAAVPKGSGFFAQVGDTEAPITLLYVVRHCRRDGQKFQVGAHLLGWARGTVEQVASELRTHMDLRAA